jgi:predicted AAA+ superfamily ATPase
MIELYVYSFNKCQKLVNMIVFIKLLRKYNNYTLVEANEIAESSYYFSDIYYGYNKPKKSEVCVLTTNDPRMAFEMKSELEAINLNTEMLYNGNMKTLELLYGK